MGFAVVAVIVIVFVVLVCRRLLIHGSFLQCAGATVEAEQRVALLEGGDGGRGALALIVGAGFMFKPQQIVGRGVEGHLQRIAFQHQFQPGFAMHVGIVLMVIVAAAREGGQADAKQQCDQGRAMKSARHGIL